MNISVMIDAVIVVVMVICISMGWRRGLIRSLLGLAAVVTAVVLSTQIAKAAAPKIIDQYLRPATYAAIEQRAEEISKEAEASTIEELRRNVEQVLDAIPNDFIRSRARAAVNDMLPIGEPVGGALLMPLTELGKDMADAALNTVVRDVVQSILCAILFAVISFLLRIVTKVLRIAEKLPGIRQLNELGGALVGAAKGLILVCLAVWVLRQTNVITLEMAEASMVLGVLPGWISGIGK
ncbi:MAG: CvpA family protein [Oscillospiraceae bacterium]|nr:CvpA family protein [Oscillospiraceae bacterium]